MKTAFLILSILGVFRCGFAQQWRTPIAVDIPTRFDINLRGIPSRCYKVVRPADGRITAQVVGPGDWNLCVGDQNCPVDCMSGSLRKVSTEPLTSGTHYYVMVERRGGDAMASLHIYPTAGGVPSAPIAIIGAWTAVIPSKNFRKGGYRISQNGSQLRLQSPDGAWSSAYIKDDSTIVAEQWKITGSIGGGGKRIDWANGSYWEAAGGVPSAPSAIIGTWTAVIPSKNFRKGGYRISQNGSQLRLQSPDGAWSSAYIKDDSTIVAEQWKTTGSIGGGGKRIDWANGSYWER